MARINDKKDSVAIEEGKKYDLFIDSLVDLILSHIFMDTQLLIIAFLRIRTLDKLFEATIALVNFRICN